MAPLSIIAFLDGRLGHEKQTRGVLEALRRLTPTSVQFRYLPSLSLFTAIKQWGIYLATAMLPKKKEKDASLDLIIGSGSYTHIPMLLLKRNTNAKAITCMCPDRLLIRHMDLCFIPAHDRVKPAENIFITTGPPNLLTFNDDHDAERGLILIGGIDRRSHVWDSEAIISQVKTIIQQSPSIKWTVSSSPRTPEPMILMLEAIEKQYANVDVVLSKNTPRGWVENAYRQNAVVWVTADSVEMIYEALTAGCWVGILPVQWKKQNSKFVIFEKELLTKGWVCSYDRWLSGKWTESRVVHLDEAGRCAVEILKRWWPERLP
jgi:mitochondrial fission protein ELM1